ncbi:MAG: hypothetical protein ABJF11_14160 [Reichenbachiella sp.]|uniref:hypothetical protein n=1 Tax=Reichenbachiella sp. TaxID=2184521 RepID=UPI003267CE70
MSTPNDNSQGNQAFVLPKNTKVTEEIISELDNMLSFTPPRQLKHSLLKIYMLYLISEHDALPGDFEDIATDFYFLVEFFITAEKEMNKTQDS